MENTQPTVSSKLNPKFFFISLGLFIALVATVSSFITVVFSIFDKIFPDSLYYSGDSSNVALSILIIMFPAFLILSIFWKKYINGTLSNGDMFIKKWMLYLITFFAVLIAVIDLVTLVQYFISGEITVRFVYKVLSVFVVSGAGAFYYIRCLKPEKMLPKEQLAFRIFAVALVVIAVFGSFWVFGSPVTQRKLRLDSVRVSDLQSIQYQVSDYSQQKNKLPNAISDLTNLASSYPVPVDPESAKGINYEYKKTSDNSFDLCTTFSMKSTVSVGGDTTWSHPAGYFCFSRTTDNIK